MINIFKYDRVCIVGTIYGLLLYMLYSKEDELKKTYFFLADTLPNTIKNNIKNKIIFKENIEYVDHIKYLFKYRVFYHFLLCRFSFIIQDFFGFSSYLLGNYNYLYLEDSPRILRDVHYTGCLNQQKKVWDSLSQLHKLRFSLFSKLYFHIHAQNKLCKGFVGTVPIDEKYLHHRMKQFVISIDQTWRNASIKKRELILETFNLTQEIIESISNKKVILLTQPFETCISESELIEIYSNAIKNYDISDIIIKTHPRDKINYAKYFPGIQILDTPIPFQLLNLFCTNLETAITINSSAVKQFANNPSINIVWLGSEVHPNILKACGHIDL